MLTMTRPTVVTAPSLEPVTLIQAKKQLEISASDTTHDDQISLLIQAAREQWEHDTDSAVLTQTLRVYADAFGDEFYLPRRPIQSITTLKYYDTLNAQQTLASSVYSLNAAARTIQLKYQQVWPSSLARWDAIEITYVAGYTSVALVPAIVKQAMLLLVGKYFENRDLLNNDLIYKDSAYENLVSRYQRATYP